MAEEKTNTGIEESSTQKVTFTQKIKNYFTPKGVQLEMLRYRPNKLAYNLALLAAVFLAVGFCVFYSSTGLPTTSGDFNLFGSNNPGPWLGIDIVLNIVMMLIMLSVAIEIKSYALTSGYFSMVIGVFQIARVFMLPLSLTQIGTMAPGIFTTITIMYIISGVLSIISGFLSVFRGTALRKYLTTVKPIENEKVGK